MSDKMAYRRYRSRRGATRYARASYSEVYDLHTEFGKTTLIGIHTPTTNRWQRYLSGFCEQFKRFRYKGASVSFVPVATLPADPLQVSYEAGEPTVDPRDLMNPIIHCGMRGESMGNYLDEIFHLNISDKLNALDVVNIENDASIIGDLEKIYYTALSSPIFRKSHPQHGFSKKGLHPMVYGISTNRPQNYAIFTGGESYPTIGISSDGLSLDGTASDTEYTTTGNGKVSPLSVQNLYGIPYEQDTTAVRSQFFTNKLQSLGWLDTIQNYAASSGTLGKYTASVLTGLPKVYMYFIMLPPAYKQEMYFRVVIRHFFEFSGFRTMIGPFSLNSSGPTLESVYDGSIENAPVESTALDLNLEPEVASLDVYNGEATLLSDGAM